MLGIRGDEGSAPATTVEARDPMENRQPNRNRLSLRARGGLGALALTALVVLTGTGCAKTTSGTAHNSSNLRGATITVNNEPTRITGSASSGNAKGDITIDNNNPATWPGTPDVLVPFPGRMTLPDETCRKWDVNHPQPVIIRDGKIYTVVDARRSFPPQCDYRLDEGMGVYSGASYSSNPKERLDGTTHIPDGQVVQVVAFSLGQKACNDGGNSPLWLGVEEASDGQTEWGWIGNFGGAPTLDQLNAHVRQLATPYAGTVLPSC